MYGLSFLNSGNATKHQADWTDALDEDDYHKESQHIIAEQANVLRTHEDMQNQGSRLKVLWGHAEPRAQLSAN